MTKIESGIKWDDITDPTKYINTRMLWSDIKEKFPDRWVALKDIKYDTQTGIIIDGILIAVCKDFEVSVISVELDNKKEYNGICWLRTTELEGNVLWTDQ